MKIWPTRESIKFPDSMDDLIAAAATEALKCFVWFVAVVGSVFSSLALHPMFWILTLVAIGLLIQQIHITTLYDAELREATQSSHETDQQVKMEEKS